MIFLIRVIMVNKVVRVIMVIRVIRVIMVIMYIVILKLSAPSSLGYRSVLVARVERVQCC